jgi:hypothetical protein
MTGIYVHMPWIKATKDNIRTACYNFLTLIFVYSEPDLSQKQIASYMIPEKVKHVSAMLLIMLLLCFRCIYDMCLFNNIDYNWL